MTWFTENPTPPVVLGIIIAAVFAVVLAKTGRRDALWGIILTVLTTSLVVAANILIVTPREEVTTALDDMRQLIVENDRQKLLERISPTAHDLRNNVHRDLAYHLVESAKINDLEVLVAASNVAATAKFIGVIDLKDAGHLPMKHFVFRFTVDLKKVDGVWIVEAAKWEPYRMGGQGGEDDAASPNPVAKITDDRIG